MGLVTCYDSKGNMVQKESVDARECVQHCGFTYDAPQVEAEPVAPIAKSPVVESEVEPAKLESVPEVEAPVKAAPWAKTAK